MIYLSIAIFILFFVQIHFAYKFGASNLFRFKFGKPLHASEDAIASLRAKMEADPNYNPMTDPQAASLIDEILPDYLKELPHAIERLSVAFKDATTGPDAAEDIDAIAASVPNKLELISSPQSDFFKNGMKLDGDEPDSSELESALQSLRQKYPQVPIEE
mmetsp:Transcript_85413/g.167133  ORF Transcript_85413/g.167133 Transcript_85413/m.167133 type:complete len:160 (-) Transcript_85413:14-493(-)